MDRFFKVTEKNYVNADIISAVELYDYGIDYPNSTDKIYKRYRVKAHDRHLPGLRYILAQFDEEQDGIDYMKKLFSTE